MSHEQFLALASELGITVVGIGDTRHPLLGNESFPFHQQSQIFTPPAEVVESELGKNDPAAWVLAKRANIWAGVGNSGQCQADTSGLCVGVWVQLVDDEWGRVA